MRIVQITDIHITPEGAESFEVNTRANFIRILEEAKKLNPDKVVITGDFCFRDPQPSIYEWVKAQLAEQELTIEFISGNHDDPRLLAELLGKAAYLQGDELYYRRHWAQRAVFFLDSTVGVVSQEQLVWLAAELQATPTPVLVFVHHPPVDAGVPFMDSKHYLKNREELMGILLAHGHPVNVYCGHYHVEKTINRANVTVQITPSCFVQVDQYQEDFKADHHRVALRVISLREKDILSTVHYFDGQ